MNRRLAALCAATLVVAAFPAVAGAHPEDGETYIPWADTVGFERAQELTRAQARAEPSSPGAVGFRHVGNVDQDGRINSDLAFNGKLAYAGNFGGFRILDIRNDQPRVVADQVCNGPQNDVSFVQLGRKTFLFQSIDTPQTAEDCSSTNSPLVAGARVGYEGVRVFDVTNPARPKFVDMIQTACGSHTNTLIPDDGSRRGREDRAFIYVSSYPLGSGVTPPGAQGPGDFRACNNPHKKISIIEVSAPRGEFSFELKEQPLSDDTTPYRGNGMQACHDVQAFLEKDIALGSCAGDSQLWDISDPWNPTTNVEGRHTHIRRPASATGPREFEFMHSGVFTWDGKYFATMDETGGGVEARCDGPASQDGYYYFYKVVRPGALEPPLLSKYTIPRPQTPEICVSHNATVIPVKGRYLMTAAYYMGGVSMVDFTDPTAPREAGYADLSDEIGKADEWSSYWYNGRVFSNSGLNDPAGSPPSLRPTRDADDNRGFDVYRLTGGLREQTRGARRWSHSNPQTQEAWQAP